LKKKQKNLKPINKIVKIDPAGPDPGSINRAAAKIKKGGVVVFPTRCLYGLGADAFNPDALEKIFHIKQRPLNKPLSILVAGMEDILALVTHIPNSALQIMEKFWPGQITLIFKANPDLPSILTGGSGKIGIRLPEHRGALALVKAANIPITGTSANISGMPGCCDIKDLDPLVAGKTDCILDSGKLKGGPGSTIIDLTAHRVKILREGEVSAKKIFDILKT